MSKKTTLTAIIITLLALLLASSVSALNLTLEWNGTAYETSGTWNHNFDSGYSIAQWYNITWNSNEPSGTNIQFRARTAADNASLSAASWSSYIDTSGTALSVANNQWIEVEVNLSTNNTSATPILYNFTLNYAELTLPIYTSFASFSETTNFSAPGVEVTNVSAPVLKTSHARIHFIGSGYNVEGKNLDTAITFADNFVRVDSVELPTFNNSANITMYGVSYPNLMAYNVIKNGQLCADCVKYASNPVIFGVSGFSNYTTNGTGVVPEFGSSSIIFILLLIGIIGLLMVKKYR